MYICPTCNRSFEDPEKIAKHFLPCWKEHNPNHMTKHVPQGETKNTREMNDEIFDFFSSLIEEDKIKCQK